MEEKKFKPCGECSACCDGHLKGKAHGNFFGGGKPCVFLLENLCSIYESRPQFCHKYQCAWTQHILDEDMRPDKCGLMVSVETDNGEQFLKAIEIWKEVPYSSYEKLDKCAKELGAKWVLVKYHDV
jgi:Fe-S-cluster containining protein